MNFEYDPDILDQQVVYIVGNSRGCFAFNKNNKVSQLQQSLDLLDAKLSEVGFLRVNFHTLINTRYYIGKQLKKRIILRDGSVHKVSRQRWKDFK